MKLKSLFPLVVVSLLLSLVPSLVRAQDTITDAQIEELRDVLNSAMNQGMNGVVNGMMVFGSQRAVSSGAFVTRNSDDPDTQLDVKKVNFDYMIGDEDRDIVPYITGTLGVVKITDELAPFIPNTGTNDFIVAKSSTVALGGGVVFKPIENLQIFTEFQLAYSHVENNYDYNNIVSQYFIRPLMDKRSLNWHLDMFTYSPAAKIQYDIPVTEETTVSVSTRYSHMFNDSFDSTTSGTIVIDSATGLLQSRVEGVTPFFGLMACEDPIKARVYFQRNDVNGDLRDERAMDFFYDTGLDLFADVSGSSEILSEIGLGLGYTYRDQFEGWRFGISKFLNNSSKEFHKSGLALVFLGCSSWFGGENRFF